MSRSWSCRYWAFLFGVVLGHRDAVSDPIVFLQTELAVRVRAKGEKLVSIVSRALDPSDIETTMDMNGRLCHLCSMPLPERSDRSYAQRSDCGNQSLYEHPENWYKPIFQFNREARGQEAKPRQREVIGGYGTLWNIFCMQWHVFTVLRATDLIQRMLMVQERMLMARARCLNICEWYWVVLGAYRLCCCTWSLW